MLGEVYVTARGYFVGGNGQLEIDIAYNSGDFNRPSNMKSLIIIFVCYYLN